MEKHDEHGSSEATHGTGFFLLVFLLPAVYMDDAILQVSSHLLQRAIRIGHYVIGLAYG
jgi:membrane-anchored protein YejM (alkaline phosphatase superfamily)